jgi:hypothetical protein
MAQAQLRDTRAQLRRAIRANLQAQIDAETEKRAAAKRNVTESTKTRKNLGKKKARLLKAVTSYNADTTEIAELARAPNGEGAAAPHAEGGAAIANPVLDGEGGAAAAHAEGGAAIANPVLDGEGAAAHAEGGAAPVVDAEGGDAAEEEGDQ